MMLPFNGRSDIRLLLGIYELRRPQEHENVVGRTRAQPRVCGARGRRDGVSLWHGSVRVSYGRVEHCVLKLHGNCVGS
jgi:hypothetical protein